MADIITELKGLDDAALSTRLGYDKKLSEFKSDIELADGLKGDARKNVADKIDRMLSPNIYPEEIKWAVQREQRKEAKATTPDSVLSDCGCVEPYD